MTRRAAAACATCAGAGPRALGNRSIVCDPRRAEIVCLLARSPGLGHVGAMTRTPMELALAEAAAAAARGEVPVGAVLVQDGRVVAAASNRTEEASDPTAHAEILVIRYAARTLGRPRLVDCDLYVTLEPCPMCAHAISLARIRRLYYGAADPKGGGVEHGPRIFASPSCHHAPEVYGGIGERPAAALLHRFFRARR